MRTEAPALALTSWHKALWECLWVVVVLVALLPWSAHGQSVESVLAPGDVIAGHAKLEGVCASCHVRFSPKGQDALCMDCHKEVSRDVKSKSGFHGRLKGEPTCRSCHTDHKGRQARIVQFDPKKFDHRQSDYLLKAKHQDVACDQCHLKGKKYWQAASDCLSCHKKDDVHKGGIGGKCSDCHSESGWKDTSFDHAKKTKFALEQKHTKVKCDGCHANGHYKDTPKTCIGCHKKDDEHKGQYGSKCETCHNAATWKDILFNHDADTHYALRGKHRKVQCNDCHTGPLYKQNLPEQCWDCHKRDDKHKESLGKDCATCHSESGWKDPPRFDHEKTRFPLLGKHVKADCKDCHKGVMFKEASTDCFACHKKDDKHEGTLGQSCVDCHSERDWKTTAGRFDHDKTRFPLRNAHFSERVKCAACHTAGLKGYRNTATDCYACHQKDDKHQGSQGKQCEQCHGDKDWKLTAFDHSKTRFPLTGGHRNVACSSCHETKQFKEVKRECVGCHLKDDPHKASQGGKCESCHSVRHWKAWTFDHDKQTRYALTGRHAKVKCEACHARPAPKGSAIAAVGQRCVDCHASDDPHDGQFGQRCEQCHATGNWLQISGSLSTR